MTHIFERTAVRCPYGKARRYMHDEALDMASPIAPFTVELEHTPDPLRFDERLRVHWAARDGGPFPEFTGEIVLRADPEANGAILELSGDYFPPFGAAGRAFDLFVGTKIASATAKSVLRRIAEAIEQQSVGTK